MNKVQIAIIGAGPAGLSTAIELSNMGYDDIIVFDREDEAGGTPRHCGHLGFGMFEFYRLLSGPDYAKKLAQIAAEKNITINLKHTLIDITKDILTFSTTNGIVKYAAKKIVLALGARETPRPAKFVSGIRSPNIMTTGALQRFIYMHNAIPFKNPVIIGSEVVSFSALMSSKKAGIKIAALIEESENLNSFSILKPLSETIFKTPVKLGYEIISIDGNNKDVESITILKNGVQEIIKCDGVIFSGDFKPESAILQESFKDFNHINSSVFISQAFQTTNKNFFAVGNVLRGALTAFKCFFEGKKLAKFIDDSIKQEKLRPLHVKMEVDENIQWYYPSLLDLNYPSKILTNLRVNKNTLGRVIVCVNGIDVYEKQIDAKTYTNIKIPRETYPIGKNDIVKIRVES